MIYLILVNRKNILIIILITAIFAAIAFTLVQQKHGIEKVIITKDISILEAVQGENFQKDASHKDNYDEIKVFDSNTDIQIYAIIYINNLNAGDRIDLEWIKVIDTKEEIVQNNQLTLKNESNGTVAISFVKKNDKYEKGYYSVYVKYNGQSLKSNFKID